MAQRSALARARRYLWYRPAKAVTACVLAPWSGLLAVVFLALLALLVDLAVTRGITPDIAAVERWALAYLTDAEAQPLIAQARQGQGVGLASAAIRTQERWFSGLLTGPARRFPALWNNYQYLLWLMVGLLVVALAYSFVTYLQKRFAANAAIHASTRLRRAVHTHAYRLSSLTLRSVSSGQTVSSSMRALEFLQEGLSAWFQRTIVLPLDLLWLFIFLLVVDSLHGVAWITLTILAAMTLYWLLSNWILESSRRAERQAMLQCAQGLNLFTENLNLLRLVKIFGMEQYNRQQLERLLHRQTSATQARWHWQFLSRHLRWLLAVVLSAVVGFALVGHLLDGSVKLVALIMTVVTIICLFVKLQQWQTAWQQVRKARLAAVTLFRLLDRAADVKQIVGAEFLAPLSQAVELRNLSVQAPSDGQQLLQNLSLRIGVGEQVALVGDESARLTIAYLIPRLIDPDAGEIRFDDKALPEVTLESLRRQTALVLQDELVFSDTIAMNIRCGEEKYTLQQVIEAAKAAHAHHFIMKLPQGYDTLVGDLGEPLSVSERFRIALARAILRDPTVVVIEEPPNGLSNEDESWLDDTMQRFLRGRTALLLATRQATLRRTDRVVWLRQGSVADEGTDVELLSRSEPYRRWRYLHFHAQEDEAAA